MTNFFAGTIMGFREGLEAFLIVAIILRFIVKIKRENLKKPVYYGIGVGLIGSLIFGGLLALLASVIQDQGQVAKLWESIASLVALILITTFIVWMIKNSKNITGKVENKVSKNLSALGIFMVSFVVIIREGAEIAIFTFTGKYPLLAISIGILIALTLTILVFYSLVKVDLKTLFSITLLYLILQAGFLLGYGIHEGLSALKDMNILSSDHVLYIKVYDLSGTILNHKEGVIGVPLYVLFGWYSKPEWIQFIIQYLYTGIVGFYWFKKQSK